jgi:hypothetical protein
LISLPRVFIPDPIHSDGVARLSKPCVVDAPADAQDAAACRLSFSKADAVIGEVCRSTPL